MARSSSPYVGFGVRTLRTSSTFRIRTCTPLDFRISAITRVTLVFPLPGRPVTQAAQAILSPLEIFIDVLVVELVFRNDVIDEIEKLPAHVRRQIRIPQRAGHHQGTESVEGLNVIQHFKVPALY